MSKVFPIFIRRDIWTISKDKEIVFYLKNKEVNLEKRWNKKGYLSDGREVRLSEKSDKWVFVPYEFRRAK